ncbi:protein translocase subunit secE/sec61 gamma [Panacagrimonas perspica]|uniref:Protein translocase subunit SecE n=1 Tax=Panacagrimonas perspica TaxID=381431 RepID=A0A4R7P3T2_9GAMM|nr:preprotein translocase subunit SecE [Panacagrimonas perspica]TDU28433.1 protein translocase subunit secE/sec61 gamma [Panacagrimonas perspica]THD01089.1 preprotein translocase subunit SecE [Panacagrimonas perspica]
MESQTEVSTAPRYDSLLLAAAVALLVGALGSFYYFSGEVNALVRTLGLLAATAVALALAYKTELGRSVWGYIIGARTELRKVVWPSRQETLQATLMIAVVVLITALLLWGLDSLLLWGVKLLTGQG